MSPSASVHGRTAAARPSVRDVGMWGCAGKDARPCLSPRTAPSDLEGRGCSGAWLGVRQAAGPAGGYGTTSGAWLERMTLGPIVRGFGGRGMLASEAGWPAAQAYGQPGRSASPAAHAHV